MRSPASELQALADQQLLRQLPSHSPCAHNFSSNDYLGLAQSTELQRALSEAAKNHPAGAGASRLISGNHSAHSQAEQALAEHHRCQRALLFCSGYSAGVGCVSALAQKGDFILLDRLSHASLIDGAKLSGASYRPFRHNDLNHLDSQLNKYHNKRQPNQRILILAESIYSMDGDRAPVAQLHQIAQKHDALLILDEAHAHGVLGEHGKGLAHQHQLVGSEHLILISTLSKAAGLQGGALLANQDWIELILNRARSFIYSTALLPALAATIPTALQLLHGSFGDQRRRQLQHHLKTLTHNLQLPPASSAIIPLHVGSEPHAMQLTQQLQQQHIYIPAIRYPTVARGQARLRLTLNAHHSPEQLNHLIQTLHSLRLGMR